MDPIFPLSFSLLKRKYWVHAILRPCREKGEFYLLIRIRIRMSFIARYVYTYEEFVFMTEATAAQQNDSNRTKSTDNKKNKKEQVNK